MRFSSNATNGQIFGPAMEIAEQDEADAYFEDIVYFTEQWNPLMPRAEVEKIVRSNLGYWAGYYSVETRQRVERLFRCSHPIFGPAAQDTGKATP